MKTAISIAIKFVTNSLKDSLNKRKAKLQINLNSKIIITRKATSHKVTEI